jgi:hypothetical protein
MAGMELLLNDSRGVYIPQNFAEFDHSIRSWNIDEDDNDLVILRQGPEAEYYWDAWDSILGRAAFTDSKGNIWHLYQDGDLWAYCEALMSDEDYEQFFGVERD